MIEKMKSFKGVYSIPNMLCYFRILCIPVIIALFFLDRALPGQSWPAWTAVFLFVLAGISDFLDGKIARMLGQTTVLGKFLDASTDKLLVGATLILLVAFGRLQDFWMIAAIVIYLREILIAGIREFMGLYSVNVPVSWLGKWKLTSQMVSMAFLIAGTYGEELIPYSFEIGKILFLVATVMTVLSGWDYMRAAWKTILQLDSEGKI